MEGAVLIYKILFVQTLLELFLCSATFTVYIIEFRKTLSLSIVQLLVIITPDLWIFLTKTAVRRFARVILAVKTVTLLTT